MEYLIYVMLFIMGTLLGSFCTLAVYRIPLKKDITHERSFCPNCEHKLGFLDLIPVLSYIFLGGKCRYCKQKISPKYILLEIFAGLSVLLFGMSAGIEISVHSLIYIAIGILYIVTLILIGMIDKEHHNVQKGVFLFGIGVMLCYILYLYIIEEASIYRYAIYLAIAILLFSLNYIYSKKKNKQSYTIEILMLSCLLTIFSGTECFIAVAGLTLLTVAIYLIKKRKIKEIPIAFFLCFYNIIAMIIQNFLIG